MTENKRFILKENGVIDDTQLNILLDGGEDKEDMKDLLNELHEENEQLKSEYKVLHTQHQDLRKFVENNFDEYLTQKKLNRQIIKLSDENEQLKQENYELEKFRYVLFDQMNKINQRINQRRGEN